jgi:hypothetical protein
MNSKGCLKRVQMLFLILSFNTINKLKQSMKIQYNFLVCKDYHEARTRPLIDIVGQDILYNGDAYTLVSGYPTFDDIEVTQLTNGDTYFSCIHKLLNCMLWHDEQQTEFDWFFIGDDDTFINVPELTNFIKKLSQERLEVHGRFLVNYFEDATFLTDPEAHFFAAYGGTGIWFNRNTFKAIVPTIREFIRYVADSSFSDITLGLYVDLYNRDKPVHKKIHFARRAGDRLFSATDDIKELLPIHKHMLCFHTKDRFSIAELKKFVCPDWVPGKQKQVIDFNKMFA